MRNSEIEEILATEERKLWDELKDQLRAWGMWIFGVCILVGMLDVARNGDGSMLVNFVRWVNT